MFKKYILGSIILTFNILIFSMNKQVELQFKEIGLDQLKCRMANVSQEQIYSFLLSISQVLRCDNDLDQSFQLKLVKLLLLHDKFDINTKNFSNPLLLIAVEYELPDLVKLILDQPDVDINIKNNFDTSSLDKANAMTFFNLKPDKIYKIIKLLLASGAEPFKDWREGNFGTWDELRQVWTRNLELAQSVKDGQEIYKKIFIAVNQGNIEQLIEIAKEYTLNVKDDNGNTPLHLAVLLNNQLMVKIILEINPALICVQNKKNQIPVDLAVADRHNILGYFVKTAFVK